MIVFSLVGFYSCEKQVFFAPSDAELRIIAEVASIDLNANVRITIHGNNHDGSLLWDGTRVDLTIENGTLTQNWVELEDGTTTITATGNVERGQMKITARSGSLIATPNPLVVMVGQLPSINQIIASVNPPILPFNGGRAEIVVTVYDSYFQPVPQAVVVLESSFGTLRSRGAPLIANASGQVVDYLDTTKSAVLTIYCGDKTHTVNVTLADTPEPNVKPTAQFSFSPTNPVKNETVYFNASGSVDSDGTINSYQWDFGDGSYGSGKNPTHAYVFDTLTPKTYVVTLTVYDNDGAWDALSKDVTVSL